MKQIKSHKSHEDGVSEVVGFIIILGIIMSGIALITLYGYPLLLKEEANSNIRNMEKNMIVLQNDIKSLAFKSVPYKETTLQVSGGTLSIHQNPKSPRPYFRISGGTIPETVFYPGELVYSEDNQGTFITLENGAVHTHYWSNVNGSAMLSDPRWYYDVNSKTYVIPLIRLNATSDMSQTGIGTIRMEMSPRDSLQSYDITGPIFIEYYADQDNNYNVAWKNYFESPELKMTRDPSSDGFKSVYKLSSDAQKLYIQRYNITILSL